MSNEYFADEDGKYIVRLKQTESDQESFANLVRKNFSQLNNDSKIKINYEYFKAKIKSSSLKAEEIFELLDRIEVVSIQFKGDSKTIQTVFEKINSTGKELLVQI